MYTLKVHPRVHATDYTLDGGPPTLRVNLKLRDYMNTDHGRGRARSPS